MFSCEVNSYKKEIRKQRTKFKQGIFDRMTLMQDNDPKIFWKLVNELKRSKQQSHNSIDLSTWEEYFRNLGQVPTGRIGKFEYQIDSKLEHLLSGNVTVDTLDKHFTDSEIISAVNKLKNGKSSGEDRILNEMLKYGIHALLPSLLQLFNAILNIKQYRMIGGWD